ncbi:MAG TPA: hypothetical protein VN253_15445 [Kofleriaceae bacterium]|nr:hypothetical protein [Kofleriaceae bacterium]
MFRLIRLAIGRAVGRLVRLVCRKWLVVVVVVVALSAMLVWGLQSVADQPTFVLAFVGLLANLVMAGAAAFAFKLWRAQLVGHAEHSAASQLMRAVLQAEREIHRAMQSLGTVMRNINVFPDKPHKEVKVRILSDAAVTESSEKLIAIWRQLDDVVIDVRVALGDEGWERVSKFSRAVEVFLMQHQRFMLEVVGTTVDAPEVKAPWSWRAAFCGEVDDALAYAEYLRLMVKDIVAWCEYRLGRGRGSLPPIGSSTIDKSERISLVFSVCDRQVVHLWLNEEFARRNAERSTSQPPEVAA